MKSCAKYPPYHLPSHFIRGLISDHGKKPFLEFRLAAEPRSKVTFEIESLGEQVKLTVIHDDLEPGGMTGSLISQGWPRVLANLKTLLETGDTLPDLQQNTPARLGLTQ